MSIGRFFGGRCISLIMIKYCTENYIFSLIEVEIRPCFVSNLFYTISCFELLFVNENKPSNKFVPPYGLNTIILLQHFLLTKVIIPCDAIRWEQILRRSRPGSFIKIYQEEDNILDQIYKSKYVRIIYEFLVIMCCIS